MIILRKKLFTMYDDTDSLKRMKDSDILAQKKKQAPGYGSTIATAATGAAAGLGAGAVIGGAKGMTKAGPGLLKGMSKGGKYGAIIGGVTAGIYAMNQRNKQAKANQFYNDRLEFAQRQAKRREKIDWKTNMTQRESYTY